MGTDISNITRNAKITILTISRIQRNVSLSRPILQSNPSLCIFFQITFMQQYLSSTAGQIPVPTVPRVPTVAHVDPVSGEVVINQGTVPFEAPVE
jgi:hypothetical protein